MNFILWWVRKHGETVAIAQLIKDLHLELMRRAEYACRFGIEAPLMTMLDCNAKGKRVENKWPSRRG